METKEGKEGRKPGKYPREEKNIMEGEMLWPSGLLKLYQNVTKGIKQVLNHKNKESKRRSKQG